MQIFLYKTEHKQIWDGFIKNSKNGHFIHLRDYMEYHSDRFADNSILFFEDNNLIAVLPAHKKEKTLYSHQGLTFAGLIINKSIKTISVIKIFETLKQYLIDNSFDELIYKAMPHIYHQNPSQEDIYALSKLGASKIHTELSSAIDLKSKIKFSKGKLEGVKKASKNSITISKSEDFEAFYQIMHELLTNKYQTKAVHNLDELRLLKNKFPENIKLFAAFENSNMIAGTIIFETQTVAKTQYISSTERGRELGAVDAIMNYLINELYTNKSFFDFGSSRSDDDYGFNESLLAQKEMFGARAIVQEVYLLKP
jgi:hypothetical protein